MISKPICFAFLLAALHTCILFSGETPPVKTVEPPLTPLLQAKSKYGVRDVEVRLADGSLFRGELKEPDPIVIKTAYGSLTIPVTDVLRIDRGDRLSDKETADVLAAIKDLDSDEFAKRSAAQYKLETSSHSSIDVIKAALATASPESKTRLDATIKKLTTRYQNRKSQPEDLVRTSRFEAAGQLQFENIHLKSRVGELVIKLDDLAGIRWLNRGETRSLTLDPNVGLGEWVDTGIDATPGDRIAVIVTGTINPYNNMDIGPTGSENWGNAAPFLMGAVTGKLGGTGEAFLVGNGKVWTGEVKERLYLRIHWNHSRVGRSSERSKGQFSVKIATGSYTEDLDLSTLQNNQ